MTHPWGKALDLGCPDMKGKMYRCLLTQERQRRKGEGQETGLNLGGDHLNQVLAMFIIFWQCHEARDLSSPTKD